jgi:hypothetical protein
VKNAAAFLVRHVVHDWSDANVVIILTHLRAAALPSTKLVIIENITPSASGGTSTNAAVNAIPILGQPRKAASAPLLPNFGMAGVPLYYYDLTVRFLFPRLFYLFSPGFNLNLTWQVNNLLGGTERTLEGFYDVLQQSGWRLVEVYHCPQTDSSYVVADPIQ